MLKTKEKRHMPQNIKTKVFYDLCSTCIHAKYCTFPQDPMTPVQQCEEFDDRVEVAPRPIKERKDLEMNTSVGAENDREEKSHYKGLCSDCRNRHTCVFPKPEGGVWYCEEYQ
ncbi:MAG: hypothetical protein AMJ79_00840 [Phycisphaerae bacterium SM23_30]|nr:MAG: hypothetical protein AMJ79_00840 [Phycisphaerae bacterium SM23_30]